MRRLARHAFTVLSLLSLLLCVAVGVLWVRSYWVADQVIHWTPSGVPVSHTLWSTRGNLALQRWEPPADLPVHVSKRGWSSWHGPAGENDPTPYLASRGTHRLLGVTYFDYTWTGTSSPFAGVRERGVLVPYWLVLAVFGALPAVRWLTTRRRRRAARLAAGLCMNCGYDLRASPGRCPECGAVAAAGSPGTRV